MSKGLMTRGKMKKIRDEFLYEGVIVIKRVDSSLCSRFILRFYLIHFYSTLVQA